MPFPVSFRTHKAFTLIELLCVIAIIGLLSAILLPVFARARGMARRAVCQSNMKQIGLAVSQYTQDYDEILPPRMEALTSGNVNLQNLLQPYAKSYQVFQCPSNEFRDKTMNDDGSGLSHVSYAPNTKTGIFNSGFGGGIGPLQVGGSSNSGSEDNEDNGGLFANNDPDRNDGNINVAMVPLASVQYPSTTIAFLESNSQASDFSVNKNDFFSCGGSLGTGNDDYRPCLSSPHLSFGNYLFADGHVKALKPEKTLLPVNMWHRDNIAFKDYDEYASDYIVSRSSEYYHNR